uniref:Calmodulin n=1 Tax=Macrostomum lignano TaxID=282301 RepID=A0A1I8IEW1_9PLAT
MTDSLTEEQVAECKEVFALFDKQGVGQVPTESLGRLLRALGYNPSNREVQAADLRVLLTNMGECLTEEEVEEMMQEAQVGPKGEFDYREFTRLVLSK